jgi:hypothetical protein
MSPLRIGGPAYWASGGSVVGRRGPIAFSRAKQLLEFFDAEARERRRAGDSAAALFCLRLAVDLAHAIIAASEWRRAARAKTQ